MQSLLGIALDVRGVLVEQVHLRQRERRPEEHGEDDGREFEHAKERFAAVRVPKDACVCPLVSERKEGKG